MDDCPACRSRRLTTRAVPHHILIGQCRIDGEVDADVCLDCHEDYVSTAVLSAFERYAAHALLASGPGDAAAFKFIRKTAGLRAADLAAILQADPSTVSRWENGYPFDRATWNTLCDLAHDAFAGPKGPTP